MMMRQWVCVGFLIGLLLTPVLLGEPPSSVAQGLERGVALTLREAVDLALRRIERGSLKIAHWRIAEERGNLWPVLTARGRFARESSNIVEQPGGTVVASSDTFQRYGAELSLSYNLLQFLASAPRMREAKADERLALLKLRDDEANAALRTSDAYLRLLTRWEAQRALEALRDDYLEFLHRIDERFQLQIIPALEYTRARSQLIALERELLNVQSEAIAAELELRRLAGLKPEQSIQLVFDEHDVDLASLKSAGLAGLLASAQEANPRLLANEAAVASARSRAEGARSAYYPTLSVSLSGGVGRNEVLNQGGGSTADLQYNFSSSLSVPLFDGGVRRARLAQATARVETQIREADRTEAEVKELIENGYWAFTQKEQDSVQVQRELQLSEEEFKQARERAAEGVTTVNDVLTALTRLVRLRQDRARVRSDTLLKGIQLTLAVGLYPFGQTTSAQTTASAPRVIPRPALTPPIWQGQAAAPMSPAPTPVSQGVAKAAPAMPQETMPPSRQPQAAAPVSPAPTPMSRVVAKPAPAVPQATMPPSRQPQAAAPATTAPAPAPAPVSQGVAKPALPVRQESIFPTWQPQVTAPGMSAFTSVSRVGVKAAPPVPQETIVPIWWSRPALPGINVAPSISRVVAKLAPSVRQERIFPTSQPQATGPALNAATPMSRVVAKAALPVQQETIIPAWQPRPTPLGSNTATPGSRAVAAPARTVRQSAPPAPRTLATHSFVVQVGAYKDQNNAARTQKTLTITYPNIWITMTPESRQTLYRVRLGPFASREEAERVAQEVKGRGYAVAVVPAEAETVVPAWQPQAPAPAPNAATPMSQVVAKPALPIRQETILPAWQSPVPAPNAATPANQALTAPARGESGVESRPRYYGGFTAPSSVRGFPESSR